MKHLLVALFIVALVSPVVALEAPAPAAEDLYRCKLTGNIYRNTLSSMIEQNADLQTQVTILQRQLDELKKQLSDKKP